MGINKKNISVVLFCYILWGILPVYWNLLSEVNSLFILCCRIVFSIFFTVGVLVVTGRLKMLRDIFRDKAAIRYLIPTSLLITFNWGLYIWAVNAGRVLDCSLGYYMNPLMAFVLGVLIFREKFKKLQVVAVILALTGVLISFVAFGSFPFVSIGLATSFAVYGVFKKKAGVDPVAGIAVEAMLVAPFAIIVSFVFLGDSVRAVSLTDFLLLFGGGAATAIPLVLYSSSVNHLPLNIVGFFQYISPSLTLVYGLLIGEEPSMAQIVSFVFIGLGLIVFSVAIVLISRAEKKQLLINPRS